MTVAVLVVPDWVACLVFWIPFSIAILILLGSVVRSFKKDKK